MERSMERDPKVKIEHTTVWPKQQIRIEKILRKNARTVLSEHVNEPKDREAFKDYLRRKLLQALDDPWVRSKLPWWAPTEMVKAIVRIVLG